MTRGLSVFSGLVLGLISAFHMLGLPICVLWLWLCMWFVGFGLLQLTIGVGRCLGGDYSLRFLR